LTRSSSSTLSQSGTTKYRFSHWRNSVCENDKSARVSRRRLLAAGERYFDYRLKREGRADAFRAHRPLETDPLFRLTLYLTILS
jgi:hypothetical protein